jgi:hypothetical protein
MFGPTERTHIARLPPASSDRSRGAASCEPSTNMVVTTAYTF